MGGEKEQWISLRDLEQLAQPKVAKMVRPASTLAAACPQHTQPGAQVDGYYSSGAESEATLRDNLASWTRLRLLPRCMVDVSAVDMRLQLLGAHHDWCIRDAASPAPGAEAACLQARHSHVRC